MSTEAEGLVGSERAGQTDAAPMNWGSMLERLAQVITPQEDAAVMGLASDSSIPPALLVVRMHCFMSGLLVGHGITTWQHLCPNLSGPGSGTAAEALQGAALGARIEADNADTGGKATGEGGEAAPEGGYPLDKAGSSRAQAATSGPSAPQAQPNRVRKRKAASQPNRLAVAHVGSGGQSRQAVASQPLGPGSAEGAGLGPSEPAVLSGEDANHAQAPQAAVGGEGGSVAGASRVGEQMGGRVGGTAPPSGGPKAGQGRTLADFPRVVVWWHPSKNGTQLPGAFPHASKKRVWLQCSGCPSCGEVHEWEAQAYNLTGKGGSIVCPSCDCRRGSFCSCKATSADERLAAEWHEDNPPPETVPLGSHKKVAWRCSDAGCGHVWEATPAHRSAAKFATNCPECARRGKKGKMRRLPTLANACPELAAEWDEARNGMSAAAVSCGSNRKAWWICHTCQGSWQAMVSHRTIRKGSGCKQCHK